MKRTLNLRFAAGLAVVVVVFGAGTHLLHGVQVERSAKILRKQADQAREKGDLASAQGYLRRYLSYEPGDTKALESLGLVLAEQAGTPRDRLQAMLVLDQALRRDPDLSDARRQVIEIAMRPEMARYSEARTHLKEALRRLTSAKMDDKATLKQGETEYKLGLCAEGERKYEEAANWYRLALAHAPSLIDIYVHLAGLLSDQLDKPEEADLVMDAREVKSGLVKANPKSSRAYLERARYRQTHKIDGAGQDVAKALELAPDNLEALLASAEQALSKNDYDSVRETLNRALKTHAKDERLYQALASVEIRAGRLDTAEKELKQGIKALDDPEDQVNLLWTLANIQLDQAASVGSAIADHPSRKRRSAVADTTKMTEINPIVDRSSVIEETIRQLRTAQTRPELLLYLEARLNVAKGLWNDAAQQFEEVHPLLVDLPNLSYQADLFLGRCHEHLGAIDLASSAYKRAVNLDPIALPARLGLASTLSTMGQTDEALEIYQAIFPPTPEIQITIARLRITQTQKMSSDRQDWRAADRALETASASAPDSPEIPMLRAESLAARNRDAEARSVLTNALERFPDHPEFQVALAALATNRGRAQVGLKEIDDAQQRLGDRIEIRLARAGYWSRVGGPEALQNLAPLAEGLDAFPTADQRRLLGTLADAHRILGDLKGARRLLDRMVQLAPNDLSARLAQFDTALLTGKDSDLQELLTQIHALDDRLGDGTSWRYARARYLIWSALQSKPLDRKKLDQARPILVELGDRRPSWSLVPLAEAEIDDHLGNSDGALKNYLRAIGLGDRRLEVVRRTVQLLNAKGRYAQADQVVRKLQEQGPLSGDTRFDRIAAEAALRAGDPARALKLARQSVSSDSTNYQDHLWLGQILGASGKTDEAGQELRRAVALKPDAPDARVALVFHLAQSGKTDQAKAAVEEAQIALKGQSPLALAQCLATIGQLDDAHKQFQTALDTHPDDAPTLRAVASFALATGKLDEAKTLLRSLTNLKSNGDDTDWARRTLAVLLAGGDPRQAREARTLMGLDHNDLSASTRVGEPVADRRAKAQVLAQQSGSAARQAAISLLKQIVASGNASPPDRSLLAQLSESAGDWPSAREQWRVLVTAEPDNPNYLAQYTAGLLRHDGPWAASTWMAKLQEIEPEAPRTIELKARRLVAQGQNDEAVSLLQTLAKRPNASLGAIASLLDELKQFGPAEEMYRLSAQSEDPAAVLALAQFLGRQGKSEEALALCEKVRKSAPPERIAETMLVSLFASEPDPEQTRRASEALQKAVQKDPKSAALVFEQANLRLLEGQYQEAKDLYRHASDLDPTSTGPLNNLAWLLAVADGKGPEALKLVNRAIAVAGPSPGLLDTRALAYLASGQREDAVRDLRDAVAREPSPVLYFHLALAQMQSRNPSAAAEAFQKAKDAGLRDSDIHPLEQPAYRELQASLAQSAK